jgi:iron complex outermembrane receptor protein
MHRPGRESLQERSCTAFLTTVLSLAATTSGPVAAAESTTAESQETPLFEIVVTARKRPQVLDEVPVSIHAVTGQVLADTATHDLFEMAGQVAGMVFTRAPDDGLALTLRGVGTPARSQAFDQSIALFLDGTYLAKQPLYTLTMFDVERVEVVRGPHSTEVGKNASVGALSVVSRQPGQGDALDGTASWDAERGGYAVEGGADLQLGTDTAVRLAGSSLDRHGWVRNGATGNDVPEDRDTGIRLTLRSALTDRLSGILRFQYADHERIGVPMQLVGPPPAAAGDSELDDRSFAYTSRGKDGESHHQTTAHIASAHFDFAAGGLNWVSETAWVDFDNSTLDDLDFSPTENVDFLRDSTFHQFSQELRVASPAGGKLEWLAGLFYLDSAWHSVEDEYWNTSSFVPPWDPALAGQFANGPFRNDFKQDTRSAALFANATWRATDRLRVFAGLRVTDERKDIVYGRSNFEPITLWNTVFNPPFPPTPLDFDGQFVDGNFAVQFDLGDQTTLYASYGRGNKLGGFVETNGVPNADPERDARIGTETTTSWELGARISSLTGRLFANVTLFDMDIEDFQDTTFNGSAFVTSNLPAHSTGIELETGWSSGQGLEARLAMTWADATEEIDGEWNQLTQAPRLTGVASLAYSRNLGATLRGNIGVELQYRDNMFNQRGELFPSDSFAPLGLRIAVEERSGRWGIALIGRNLTKRISADFAGPTPDPTQPPSESPAALRSVLLSGWFRR